jgi:hypothetical protein
MSLALAQLLLSCLAGDRLLPAAPSPPRLSRTASWPTSFSVAALSSVASAMPATCSTECRDRTFSPWAAPVGTEEDYTILVMAFRRASYSEAPNKFLLASAIRVGAQSRAVVNRLLPVQAV